MFALPKENVLADDQNVLFVKLGAIGDVVMALPAVQYLRERGHIVTWLCGKSVEPLVRQCSTASEVIAIRDDRIYGGSRLQRLSEVLRCNLALLGKRYSRIYVAHSDRRYRGLVALAIGPRACFGQTMGGSDLPLVTRHHATEYLRLVSQNEGVDILDPASFFPRPRKKWQGQGNKRVALAPGGARNLLANDEQRRWPLEGYVSLARLFLDAGFAVEIVGGKTDLWVKDAFAGLAVQNRIGETDLMGFVDQLSQYEILITHDTGPLHLAGLAGVPVVGLFGPTKAEWRLPLVGKKVGLELEPALPCQPCYDGRNFARCRSNECLKRISAEVVFSRALALIQS